MEDKCFTCSYCGVVFPLTNDTRTITPHQSFEYYGFRTSDMIAPETVQVHFYKCPKCEEISIQVLGVGSYFNSEVFNIRPMSNAIKFPSYVPEKIRQDYEEACAIVNLSPKSSATLSRRCLQAMIGNFWGINKNRLVDSINELKGKVPAAQWSVIDALRTIGNIGAHPEADINTIIEIEPQDAEKLIKIIEFLIKQWYIERYEQEQLFNDVLQMKADKQNQRHTTN